MISSGDSMLDVAKQLKKRKANRVFVASTFGPLLTVLKDLMKLTNRDLSTES